MLKLFQSLFADRATTDSGYPEALVDAVIERAVDGTDPRLRALGGYRKRLRQPALAAIDHVVCMVESLPPPVDAGAEGYRNDPGLRAMFASLERLHGLLGKDRNLDAALRAGPAPARLVALLLTQMNEKHVLGLDIEDGLMKRDVRQTVVSFDDHRVVDPDPDEALTRRALRRRAFDHILAQVLEDMGERTSTRQELGSQRALLRRKLDALKDAGWSFGAAGAGGDPAALEQKLVAIEAELQALGPESGTLEAHLDLLAAALADPAARLSLRPRTLILDHRNVLREVADSVAREFTVHELHDGRGARVAVRLLSIDPALLARTDFFAAAQRYL